MLKTSFWVKRQVSVFLCLLLCLILMTACSKTEKKVSGENTVTFTDALNRQLTIKKNPQRVAALIGSFADVWLLSGGEICATAEDAWDDFGLDLPDAENLGGAHSPSLEALLSAEPELVIASASTASNVEMKETLENANITVAYFDVDCFEDYLEMLSICTDITGRKDLYEQNGLNIKAQIEAIKEKVKNSTLTEKERTVLLLRASSGSVKAKGSEGTVLGEMLCDLGCVNIADNNKTLLEELSVEKVILEEPYRIFVVTMGDATEKAIKNLKTIINGNPAWSTLGAVKENRLYFMDRKLFNLKPNAKWTEAYEKLGEILCGGSK